MALAGMARNVHRLTLHNSVLFVCDLQDKFRTIISHFDAVAANSGRLVTGAKLFDIPIVATEQYPKGLGHTVPEVCLQEHGVKAYEKTAFCMCIPEVVEELSKLKRDNVVICGIESHICVQETVLQLLQDGYSVHVVADAVSSRAPTDRLLALGRMRASGALLTSTEAVLMGLCGGKSSPHFKAVQKMIMTPSADTGLLPHLAL